MIMFLTEQSVSIVSVLIPSNKLLPTVTLENPSKYDLPMYIN